MHLQYQVPALAIYMLQSYSLVLCLFPLVAYK
nr:MAG TPA: hypothetical protein [Caudoviricetes sp.]